MNRSVVYTVCVLGLSAFAPRLSAQTAQPADDQRPATFAVDESLALAGKKVFAARGCHGCHTIGKGDLAAPDLGGLLERRSTDWIRRWLHDPWAMVASDDTAKALYKRYNNLRMPNLQLSDQQITALMHYIASQTAATRPAGTASQ